MRQSRAAVRWWQGAVTEASDGTPLQSEPSVAVAVAVSADPGVPHNEGTRYLDTYRSSMIDTPVRVGIETVVAVVDVPAATGRTLNAVAAYLAFVGLARVRPLDRVEGNATILNLFSGSGVTDLTSGDLAYLSALYTTPANRPATMQRKALITKMADALE